MNLQKQKKDNGQIQLTVTLDKKECEDAYKLALSNVREGFDKKGFRKGKAPEGVIKKNAKNQLFALYERALAQKSLKQALEKEDLKPAIKPEVHVLASSLGTEFKCKILVAPAPEVELGKYKDLKIKKDKISIDDKEINKALNFLRQSRAKHKDVKRAAKKGDQLDISFDAFYKDKKSETGSTQHYPLRLGESQLHKKFEKQLVGMKSGDEKTFTIDFPKDWPQTEFQGKKMKFKVKVNSVSKVDLPELNDDFARSLGEQFNNVKKLKDSLKSGLKQEKERENAKKAEKKIFKKIIKNSKINIPSILIEKEKDKMSENFRQQLENKKIDFKSYLKKIKTTEKELKKNLAKQAEGRLQSAFVIGEIAKKEKLFPSQEELEQQVNAQLKKAKNSQKSPKDIDFEALRSYTFQYLTNQKVISWLLDKNICV